MGTFSLDMVGNSRRREIQLTAVVSFIHTQFAIVIGLLE